MREARFGLTEFQRRVAVAIFVLSGSISMDEATCFLRQEAEVAGTPSSAASSSSSSAASAMLPSASSLSAPAPSSPSSRALSVQAAADLISSGYLSLPLEEVVAAHHPETQR